MNDHRTHTHIADRQLNRRRHTNRFRAWETKICVSHINVYLVETLKLIEKHIQCIARTGLLANRYVVCCSLLFNVVKVFYGASIWFRISAECAVHIPQFNEYARFSCSTTQNTNYYISFYLLSFPTSHSSFAFIYLHIYSLYLSSFFTIIIIMNVDS